MAKPKRLQLSFSFAQAIFDAVWTVTNGFPVPSCEFCAAALVAILEAAGRTHLALTKVPL